MKKVTAFKASDNRIFDTKEQAEEHESYLNLVEVLRDSVNWDEADAETVAHCLMNHFRFTSH